MFFFVDIYIHMYVYNGHQYRSLYLAFALARWGKSVMHLKILSIRGGVKELGGGGQWAWPELKVYLSDDKNY